MVSGHLRQRTRGCRCSFTVLSTQTVKTYDAFLIRYYKLLFISAHRIRSEACTAWCFVTVYGGRFISLQAEILFGVIIWVIWLQKMPFILKCTGLKTAFKDEKLRYPGRSKNSLTA